MTATAWQPTESMPYHRALVVMVPTMSEYFDLEELALHRRDKSEQRDFVAISRLADIQNILGSLQVVHQNVSPLIQRADANQDAQIGKGLTDLKSFVADVYQKEQSGQRFSPEDADLLGQEAQDRATAITGQVAQMAAKLNIKIEEQRCASPLSRRPRDSDLAALVAAERAGSVRGADRAGGRVSGPS